MRSIVYVSSGVEDIQAGRLDILVAGWRERNRQSGVTSVLLRNGGNFMQCVEGPAQAAGATFARISASKLHRGIIELLDEPILRREFGGCHLAVPVRSDAEELDAHAAGVAARLRETAAQPQVSASLFLLRDFWTQLGRPRFF